MKNTNGLPQLNEEIKRRTRAVRIFPNLESCLRLTGRFIETHEMRLADNCYLNVTLPAEQKGVAETGPMKRPRCCRRGERSPKRRQQRKPDQLIT